MKKVFLIICAFIIIGVTKSTAQVTIGSLDTPNATLDVKSQAANATSHDGIIAPKLTGDELARKTTTAYSDNQNGALVYVTAAASIANQTGKTVNVKTQGYYYYDSANSVWVSFSKNKPEWFYMPPTLINTAPGTGKIIDLFAKYNTSVTHAIKSGGADFSQVVDSIGTAENYDYYVVGYDETVFDNISISPEGVMTYDVVGRATEESYITIIFVRK